MHVSNNNIPAVGLRQPPKTSTSRRPTQPGREQKKLPNYVQQELAQLAEQERTYNLTAEVPELLKLKCGDHLPLEKVGEAHTRLDKAIDFFNENAQGYPTLAESIKKLKRIRSQFKVRLDKLNASATSAGLDEAA